ncbi:MAG: HAD family hydrolase [Deltaproteobacteria bacterium]|nr:HAD family hydrolase [Deltaproteobacteria bacterium]
MNFKAVIFDLDGTLLDTIEDLADSMNAVLNGMGAGRHDVEAYKYMVGDGVENLCRRALPENLRDEQTVGRSVEAMRTEYGKRWMAKTKPYDGIPDLLDSLSHSGLKMAVLSNKVDEFTRKCVVQLLSRWRFDAILGARPDAPKKPDPSGAFELAERLSVSPGEVLYVGDTGTDMRTAVSAGMYAVGALWGFRTAEELLREGARMILRTPFDLLPWI